MLLGHWIEMRSINQAQGALKELAKLLPDMALRLDEAGTAKEVPVAELKRGDLLLIRPGASIPADGGVKEGPSAVNEAMITGESKPMDKSTGDRVIAGTVNGQGSLRIEVTGTGAAPHYASLRAGDIVGEHLVQFATDGERIELVHRAGNRDIFARGALHAALALAGRQPGVQRLRDLL